MLEKINRMLEKRLPFITPICVLSGITFLSFLHSFAFLVPWIFACITFSSSLGLKIIDIGNTFKKPTPIFVCLLIIQGIMPLLAFGIGSFFFADNIYLITGLLLAFVIPTGIVSLMWVSIHKGNNAISLTIILVNTMLSPFLVPLTLKLFIGTEVSLNTFGLMAGLFWMIVIPSVMGIMFHHFKPKRSEVMKKTLAPFSKLGLLVVILINSSVISPYFTKIDMQFIKLIFVLVFLAIVGYGLGLLAANLFKWDREMAISLAYNSGLRNNGVGAALAITYFPPQVTLPIIVAILFQQILAASFGNFITKSMKNGVRLGKVSNF